MSTAITVQCSNCSAKLKLNSSASVGKKVKCPKCQQPFVVKAPPADDFAAADDPFGGFDDFGDGGGGQIPMAVASGGKATARKGAKGKKGSSSGGWQKPALIGGGIVALVLLIGGGVWSVMTFFSGGSNEQGDEPAQSRERPANRSNDATPPSQTAFMDESRSLQPTQEWNREIVCRNAASVRLRITSEGPMSVTFVTKTAYDALSRQDMNAFQAEGVMLGEDSNAPTYETTLALEPGSYFVIIRNNLDRNAQVRLECFDASGLPSSPALPSNAAGPPGVDEITAPPSSNSLPERELDIAGTAVFDAMPLYPGSEMSEAYVDDRGWGRRTYRCTGDETEEEVRTNYEQILVEQGWTVEVKPNEFFTNSIDITATKENLTVVVTVDTGNEGVGLFFVTRVNEGDGVPSPSGLPGITLPNSREPDMEGTRVLDDLPPYPGATLFNAVVFDDSVNKFAIRIYTTPDSLETVGKYYWRVLIEAGWSISDVIPQDNSSLGRGGYKIQAFMGDRTLSVLAFIDEEANTTKIEFTAHLPN